MSVVDPPAELRDDPRVVAAWHAHRRRVFDIAYRMVGSVGEAEDVAQEAFLRLLRADVEAIKDVEGWLVTVTSRLCFDHLRSAYRRRQAYVGPWLPEPIVQLRDDDADPADRVTLDESVRMALLVVLEQLTPAERIALVLHDVFQLPFESVAATLGRSAEACRQLASRARRRIRDDAAARFRADDEAQRMVAERFAAACANGDLEDLVAVLHPNALGEFDSGGLVPGASTEPVVGAVEIARMLVRAFRGRQATFAMARVNGEPGVVVAVGGRIVAVVALAVEDGRVHHLHAVGNPRKLDHLPGLA